MRPDGPSRWRNRYTAVIQEVDSEKLLTRIYGAKMAICDRMEELGGHGNSAERLSLKQALNVLGKLEGLYFYDLPKSA